METMKRIIDAEWEFLQSEHRRWSLTEGPQNMELVAHALRVMLHLGQVPQSLAEYHATVDVQHPDGGWSPESNGETSAAWVSAFCGLMLIRAHVVVKDAQIRASIERSIRYFLNAQKGDGRWVDPSWSDLDTTSHPVSFFNVVLALGEPSWKQLVYPSWRRGVQFILDGQSKDGGWYDETFHPTGVETTAHLVQDSLIASLFLPDAPDVREASRRGMEWLLKHQEPEGSWDSGNEDHTMDSTRSLLIIGRSIGEEQRCGPVIERALQWIIKTKNEHGWPDFPGMETNLERTCDGIDVLTKYLAYKQADPLDVVRRWGYVTGAPTYAPATARVAA